MSAYFNYLDDLLKWLRTAAELLRRYDARAAESDVTPRGSICHCHTVQVALCNTRRRLVHRAHTEFVLVLGVHTIVRASVHRVALAPAEDNQQLEKFRLA